MSLSNLYFRGCFEQPSDDQKLAVESISSASVEGDVVDRNCSRDDINTCGISIERLFALYPIYNFQRGLYKSWGDIEFPWQITNLTPNLLVSGTDDRWKVSSYRSVVAYFPGDRVLYIEDDGYRVSLYSANEHIFAISGAFDYSKWTKICHIETTVPAGLPSLEFLRKRYPTFSLDLFDDTWGDYSALWSSSTYKPNLQACIAGSDEILRPNDTYTGSVVQIAETYNDLPVRGFLHIPEIPDESADVVVLYHGTISSRGSTPATASQRFLDIVLNPNGLNLGTIS